VIPFTTNLKWGRFPFGVNVNAGDGGLTSDSVALCHQTRVCDKTRLETRLGRLSPTTVARIEAAVRVATGM
jgi:mRNA interferase MazF